MAKEFQLSIMTPREIFFSGRISQLNLEIFNGRIGFLADHVPTTSSIKTSSFSIIENGVQKEGVIIGGIVYMDGKEATIVTSRVIWLADVDKSNVKKRLDGYKQDLENKKLSVTEQKFLKQKILYYQKQLKI